MISKAKMITALTTVALVIQTCGSTIDALGMKNSWPHLCVPAFTDGSRAALATLICPRPYTNILGECFYVHKFEPLLTWHDAKAFCKQAGGVLAETDHFGAIIAQLFNEDLFARILQRQLNRFWVGGHRTEGGTDKTFKWSSGRPMNVTVAEGGARGDCVMIVMSREGPFQLKGAPCDDKTYYICQLL